MEKNEGGSSNKVLIIGLDGGTYTVLRPLIDAGKLPTLAAMMERGSWGELTSTIPPHTAPAWASFITGKNPGKNGIFQFRPIDRSLYEGGHKRIVNARTISEQKLWGIIGRKGKKVGLINVPLTYPPQPVNGFMVTGMLTPTESDRFTYPPHLASSLGDYKIDVTVAGGYYGGLRYLNKEDPEVLEGFIKELKTLVDKRTEAAIRLMKIYSPDFFLIFFTETDRLQHILWPHLQLDQRQFEGITGKIFRRIVEEFFKNLDNNLAKLVNAAGEDTVKILMSDHGFGPAAEKNVNFNVWLLNRGLLKLQKGPRNLLNPRRWLKNLGLSREILDSLMSFLFPGNVARRFITTCGKVISKPIDWSGTKAIFIPLFEFVGGIQIILQQGTPPREGRSLKEYEDFRHSLIQQLLELRDPKTNQPIVLEAYRREEVYKGIYTQNAPDIIFKMATAYRGEKGLLSKSLVTEKPEGISLWTGTHRQEGIVILSGPNISPGKIPFTPQIQDLTPTILYLLGIAIPEDMDGRVIEEAIEPSYLVQNKIEYTKPMAPEKRSPGEVTTGFSEEEMEKVRRRLESLGYLS
jgi:predicted AlkP superfamily phosphohydrolase/phosphomutase